MRSIPLQVSVKFGIITKDVFSQSIESIQHHIHGRFRMWKLQMPLPKFWILMTELHVKIMYPRKGVIYVAPIPRLARSIQNIPLFTG
jgi:hypothetical protein